MSKELADFELTRLLCRAGIARPLARKIVALAKKMPAEPTNQELLKRADFLLARRA